MFNIPPVVEQTWAKKNKPKAAPADIAMIELAISAPLPRPYVDFVTRYGFVIFGDDPDRTCLFSYAIDKAGQREVRQQEAAFLRDPHALLKAWRIMIDASNPDDESSPMIPTGYLPIGSDPGQGALLLEIASGKVCYWRESEWRWGTENNKQLGVVADTFEDFINGLRPDPL